MDVSVVLPGVICADLSAGEYHLHCCRRPRIAFRNAELELDAHILEVREVYEVADRNAGT